MYYYHVCGATCLGYYLSVEAVSFHVVLQFFQRAITDVLEPQISRCALIVSGFHPCMEVFFKFKSRESVRQNLCITIDPEKFFYCNHLKNLAIKVHVYFMLSWLILSTQSVVKIQKSRQGYSEDCCFFVASNLHLLLKLLGSFFLHFCRSVSKLSTH